MKRAIITGTTSFAGIWIVQKLVDNNYEVTLRNFCQALCYAWKEGA